VRPFEAFFHSTRAPSSSNLRASAAFPSFAASQRAAPIASTSSAGAAMSSAERVGGRVRACRAARLRCFAFVLLVCRGNLVQLPPQVALAPSDKATTTGSLCPTVGAGHPTRSQARSLGGRTGSSLRGAHQLYPVPAARRRSAWCARFDRLTPPPPPPSLGRPRVVSAAPNSSHLGQCLFLTRTRTLNVHNLKADRNGPWIAVRA